MSRNQRTVVTTDTLREVVMVTLHDTVWEHTTLTLRVNESGDTLQSSTVTDRLTVRDRTRDRQTTTHSRATLDSVAVVSNETTTVAVTSAQHDVEIDPDGNLSVKKPKGTVFLQTVKWLTLLLAVLTVLRITTKPSPRSAS